MSSSSQKLWDKFNGEIAVVEDGSIVLYVVDRDMERGYGVERVARIPTTIRAAQSNIDPSLFPLPVVFESSLGLGGHHLVVPDTTHRLRKVRIEDKFINHQQSTTTRYTVPEENLTTKESEKRWYYIRRKLLDEGRLFVAFAASRLPRKSKEMFVSWADTVARGSNEDEATDFLYDKFGMDLANDFLRATRLSNGWRFEPKHAPPSSMVFMLESKKSKYEPLAVYGEIPEVAWATLPW